MTRWMYGCSSPMSQPSLTMQKHLEAGAAEASLAGSPVSAIRSSSYLTMTQILGQHYGFSPRLLASMMAMPSSPVRRVKSEVHHRNYQEFYQDMKQKATRNRKPKTTVSSASTTGHFSADVESIDPSTPTYSPTPMDINHYRIVDEVWHFASVDWGHRCTFAVSGGHLPSDVHSHLHRL